MRFVNYGTTMTFHVANDVRTTIEDIANSERRSMAEVTRALLTEALTARGLMA